MMSAYWLLIGAWIATKWGWRSLWTAAVVVTVMDLLDRYVSTETAFRLGVMTRDMIAGVWQ